MKKKIIAILNQDYPKEHFLMNAIEVTFAESSDEEKGMFYSTLLYLLTHLEFNEEEARGHWENVMKCYKELCDNLNRELNLRMAIIDYFTSKNRYLKNPMIIELRLYEDTQKMAVIDELTGLYNFRYFQKVLDAEKKRSLRYNMSFSIVFMDLDNLKHLNDTYGHITGDMALKEVAHVLQECKRAEDTVCRYGGDEFLCLLPQTENGGAENCITRLNESIMQNKKLHEYGITMSAGIAHFPQDSKSIIEVLDYADQSLYKAKNSGKNRVVVWDNH